MMQNCVLTRSSSIRSNLPIFACWVVNKIDCTWANFCRDTRKSLYWTCDCSGRVYGLVHNMAWMHRAAQAAHLSLEDLVKQLPQPPVQLLKRGCASAWLCSCCWAPGQFTCSSQGLSVPRLDQMYAATLECGGTVQLYNIMNERARVHTNQQLSFSHTLGSRGHQMEGAGARMRQTGGGSSSDKRQYAYMDSRVDKKSTCRRDPLMATKQTNHTRLRKSPWGGNSARKHHMHLPCFFSSLVTYGYYWRQDIGQNGPLLWTSTAVLTIF